MNDLHEKGSGDDFDTELQHRLFNRAIPYVITGLVSLIALGGTYFFGSLWSITSRLDRECPVLHQDIANVKSDIAELRSVLAEYPRSYELRAAIDRATAAAEYRISGGAAVEELRRRIEEIRTEVRDNRQRIQGYPLQYNSTRQDKGNE